MHEVASYFDPGRCPGCATPLTADASRCSACGLRLQGTQAARLGALLREADALVAELRGPERAPGPVDGPVPGLSTTLPPLPPMQLPAPRAPALSVPAVLLGLGALCVLVAATVFVAVTWGDLSVGARTLMLLGVTAAFAVGAVVVTRRGLIGSAESLWLITAGMCAVDAAGARTAGLLGLDGMALADYLMLTGAIGYVAFTAVSRWVASTESRRLVGGQLVAAGWLVLVVGAWAAEWEAAAGWYGAVVAVIAAGLALGARRLGLLILAGCTAGLAGAGWLLLAAAGAFDAVVEPAFDRLWLDGEGGQLLAASLLLAVVVLAPPRVVRLPGPAQALFATLAVGGVAALCWLPFTDGGITVATLALGLGALGLVLSALARDDAPLNVRVWLDGASATAAVGATLATLVVVAQVVAAATVAEDAAQPVWAARIGTRLDLPGDDLGLPEPWVLPILALAVTLVVLVLAAPRPVSPWGPLALVAAASGATLPLLYPAPLWAAVVVPTAFAFVLLAAGLLRLTSGAVGVGLGLLVVAAVPALGSTALTSVVATAVVVVAVGACLSTRGESVRESAALTAVLAGALALFGWLSLGSLDLEPRALVLTGMSAVVLLAAQHPRVRSDAARVRVGAEAGAAVVAVVALAMPVAEGSLGWVAVALTLTGTAVVLAALLAPDRRLLSVPGAVLLASASWVRLADTDVEVVEAYTLPSALVLVAAGCWWLRRDADAVTAVALLPGLGLAVGPSLLLALDDPVTLRGLLVGVAGVGLVLVGVALHWGAPLAVGAVAVATLAVRELAPVAMAVPRWSLLAVAGAALLAVGITWEQRRRELVAASRYMTALR